MTTRIEDRDDTTATDAFVGVRRAGCMWASWWAKGMRLSRAIAKTILMAAASSAIMHTVMATATEMENISPRVPPSTDSTIYCKPPDEDPGAGSARSGAARMPKNRIRPPRIERCRDRPGRSPRRSPLGIFGFFPQSAGRVEAVHYRGRGDGGDGRPEVAQRMIPCRSPSSAAVHQAPDDVHAEDDDQQNGGNEFDRNPDAVDECRQSHPERVDHRGDRNEQAASSTPLSANRVVRCRPR